MRRMFALATLVALLTACFSASDEVAADGWVYQAIPDPASGLVKARRPLRPSWLEADVLRVDEQGSMHHRDGWELRPVGQYQFTFSPDPGLAQIMQQATPQTGVEFMPVMDVETWLRDWFEPRIAEEGYVLRSTRPLPEVARAYDQLDFAPLLGRAPARNTALGTEWTNESGGQSFALMVHVVFEHQNQVFWSVMIRELRGDETNLADAVDDFLFSESRTEVNPEWVTFNAKKAGARLQANQAQWDQLMASSRQAHWQRMNAIQARGTASHTLASTYSDVLDVSHAGYMNRSNVVSAGQADTVRAIGGKTLIASPQSGELYQVDSTSRYHWVDAQGTHLATDDGTFDPSADGGIGPHAWTRFEVVE